MRYRVYGDSPGRLLYEDFIIGTCQGCGDEPPQLNGADKAGDS
jgi:hypothetical protein